MRIRVQAKDDLERDSDLLIDQTRAIDNRRLAHGPITILDEAHLESVYNAVSEVIGMKL